MKELEEALLCLDPENDDHWTDAGLPRMSALAELGLELDRGDVTKAAPRFTRTNLVLGTDEDPEPEESIVKEPDPETPPEPERKTRNPSKDTDDLLVAYKEATSKALIGKAALRQKQEEALRAAGLTQMIPSRSPIDRKIKARNKAIRKGR